MATIAILPAALASQIAAGEVVERPASALKELLENALDAGATRLDIEFRAGGVDQLSLRDNGSGMSREDAKLSVERHATSKLRKVADLDNLLSYGFRGEALPSISSVCRFTLQTRASDTDVGTQLYIEGGAPPAIRDVGMAPGTWVQLKDLFFNVPARRKFLRSSGTEAGHLLDVIEGAALGCPDVTFHVQRDGRKARQWLRCATREERVKSVLNGEQLAPCIGQRGPLKVEAYLSRPERGRAGASGLRLLCNGRPVRHRALLHSAAQAYGSALERGRYPRGVIYLELPPQLVDVNVHPQKTEVRFADGRAVTDAIYQVLSSQLARTFSESTVSQGRNLAPSGVKRNQAEVTLQPTAAVNAPQTRIGFNPLSHRQAAPSSQRMPRPQQSEAPEARVPNDRASGSPAMTNAETTASRAAPVSQAHSKATSDANPPNASSPSARSQGAIKAPSYQPKPNERQQHTGSQAPPTQPSPSSDLHNSTQDSSNSSDALLQVRDFSHSSSSVVPVSAPVGYPKGENDVRWSALRYISQVKGTYLLCESPEGLFVLDQHATAERTTFAKLHAQYTERSVHSQSLLFPETLMVTEAQAALIEQKPQEIERLGFELRVHDETTVSLHAIPRLLQRSSPEVLAKELLVELCGTGRSFSDAVEHALATLACHGSVRAGDSLSQEEGKALVKALDGVDFAGRCRHERPIVSFISWKELDRKTGRR